MIDFHTSTCQLPIQRSTIEKLLNKINEAEAAMHQVQPKLYVCTYVHYVAIVFVYLCMHSEYVCTNLPHDSLLYIDCCLTSVEKEI